MSESTHAFWSAALTLRHGTDPAERKEAGLYILRCAQGDGPLPIRTRALALLAEMGVAIVTDETDARSETS